MTSSCCIGSNYDLGHNSQQVITWWSRLMITYVIDALGFWCMKCMHVESRQHIDFILCFVEGWLCWIYVCLLWVVEGWVCTGLMYVCYVWSKVGCAGLMHVYFIKVMSMYIQGEQANLKMKRHQWLHKNYRLQLPTGRHLEPKGLT